MPDFSHLPISKLHIGKVDIGNTQKCDGIFQYMRAFKNVPIVQ